jgi:hypothetical protein
MAGKTNLYRELAYRAAGGIEVVLFWQETTNELTVAVSDARSGTCFKLAAAPHEALNVFNHPFAHAASRGLQADEPFWAEPADARALTSRPEER